MGKMPAGLARYWRNKRAGRGMSRARYEQGFIKKHGGYWTKSGKFVKSGGRKMARRRFGRRIGRRYGRRIARGARRAGSRVMRTIGITPTGIKASRMIIAASLGYGSVVPSVNGWSAIGALLNRGPNNATLPTVSDRIRVAGECYANAMLGVKLAGATSTYTNSGIGAMGVGAGAALGLAGKFINPLALSGSAVKL